MSKASKYSESMSSAIKDMDVAKEKVKNLQEKRPRHLCSIRNVCHVTNEGNLKFYSNQGEEDLSPGKALGIAEWIVEQFGEPVEGLSADISIKFDEPKLQRYVCKLYFADEEETLFEGQVMEFHKKGPWVKFTDVLELCGLERGEGKGR